VLTGPRRPIRAGCALAAEIGRAMTDTYDMVPVSIAEHPLTATAGLVWNGDLPRELQQVLVDTAMESFFDD
jgi:hypothetical protein